MRKSKEQVEHEARICAALAIRRAAEVFRVPEGWDEEDWERVRKQMDLIATNVEHESKERQ